MQGSTVHLKLLFMSTAGCVCVCVCLVGCFLFVLHNSCTLEWLDFLTSYLILWSERLYKEWGCKMLLGDFAEGPTLLVYGICCTYVTAIGFLDCAYLEFRSVVLIKRVQASRPTASVSPPCSPELRRAELSPAQESAAPAGATSAAPAAARHHLFSKYHRSFTFRLLGLKERNHCFRLQAYHFV